MARLLAGSCDGGPCPTFYVDEQSGTITVQGYVTALPDVRVPPGEDVVAIPSEAWARLLANLPWRMLVGAIATKARLRSSPRSSIPACR